jgi:UDP-GlcNAc:undecaprenyl-phosphate/decaprenyl-phosphate GlcNAc-1-phosphate transferase
MAYGLFFMPLMVSFAIAALIVSAVVLFGKKKNADGRFSSRHIHRSGISRFGGVALIISFIATLLFDSRLVGSAPLEGLIVGCSAILIFGIIDDLKQIDWKTQLLFQILLVGLVYTIGLRLVLMSNQLGGFFSFGTANGYFFGLVISIVWIVLLMNAMNWADGIDGVSGGVTLIGAGTIFLLSLRPEVNQPPVAIITAALVGCLLAFLLFNFNPSKILAGTSGSMFMGFALAALAIFAGAKIATTLLVLAIPVIDAIWVIAERFGAGESIFGADKRHLHFRLLELGWPQKKICLFYWSITLCIAIIALNTRAFGKTVTFLAVLVLTLGALFAVRKKTLLVKKTT